MNSRCVVLNSIEDAKHCIENMDCKNAVLIATHASPAVYLSEVENINCLMLSDFIDESLLIEMAKNIGISLDETLSRLDDYMGKYNKNLHYFDIDFFTTLYCYIGKHICLGYISFIGAMNEVINRFNIDEICLYEANINPFLNTRNTSILELAKYFLGCKIHLISSVTRDSYVGSKYKTKLFNIFLKVNKRPKYFFLKLVNRIKNSFNFHMYRNEKTILLSANLYDLGFLSEHLKLNYNIAYMHTAKTFGIFGKSSVGKYELPNFEIASDDKILSLFQKQVLDDFKNNVLKYLLSLNKLKRLVDKANVVLGIWGVPPAWGWPALAYRYLQNRKIIVMGAQHGSNYGDTYHPWHFDSDFKRCDYWVSYGATELDYSRTYADIHMSTKILPLGSAKIEKLVFDSKAKEVDVFFPLTNSISCFNGGMSRISFSKLARRQIDILKFLDAQTHISSIAKPMPNADTSNCAVIPLLEKLKHTKYISNMSIVEFYNKYRPRIIVIEFPSTPLYEALHLDVEIFLMNDTVVPFEAQALNELKKRVHYFEETEDLLNAISMFLKGELLPKRDETFLNHYVHKYNTKKNILQAIDDIIERKI